MMNLSKNIYPNCIKNVERQGKLEGKLETVPLLRQLGMSVEDIAIRLELPLEDVVKTSEN